jgi:DNA-binding transcriptional regulator YiaG
MAMHAYNSEYLSDAMENLGEAFDTCENIFGVELDFFMDLFIASGIAEMFAHGSPKYVSGRSGTELVLEVFDKVRFVPKALQKDPMQDLGRAIEYGEAYWCGWVVAYYSWSRNIGFKQLHRSISMEEISKMYPTLHEASEERFADALDEMLSRRAGETNLSRIRKARGLSQKALASAAGIGLRAIQQYEQHKKDIKKAGASTVAAMATVLGCKYEDLLAEQG